MRIRDRIGIDVGTELSIPEGIEWAARNDVHYVDFCLDDGPIDTEEYPAERADMIIDHCEEHDIHLGLHTLSAVNVAETSAHVSDAVTDYLTAYVDIGAKVGAERVIVHGGYHFTDDVEERKRAAKTRLQEVLDYAESKAVTLLLENHNHEPEDSEMHFMPVTLDECKDFFGDLDSDALGWAFNPPHARLFPEGIEGYLEGLGVERCGQVRLNDNDGEVEEHLPPGEGTMDFEWLFGLLEDNGYRGHYMLKFGTRDEMLDSREYLVDRYPSAET